MKTESSRLKEQCDSCAEHEALKKSTSSLWVITIVLIGMVISSYIWANKKAEERGRDITDIQVRQATILNELKNMNNTLMRLENKRYSETSFMYEDRAK